MLLTESRRDGLALPWRVQAGNGSRFKSRDYLGEVTDIDPSKQATLVSLATDSWLFSGASLSPIGEKSPLTYRLTVQGGASALVTFNDMGDLIEARVPADGSTGETLRFDDFRPEGSGVLPHALEYPTHEKGDVARLVKWEVVPCPVLPELRSGISWSWPDSSKNVEAPLSIDKGVALTIEAELGGISARFIVDTGEGISFLDLALVERLGIPHRLENPEWSEGPIKKTYLVDMPQLCVRGACLAPHIARAADLAPLKTALPGLGGVLGGDFFSTMVGILDLPRLGMSIQSPESFRPQPDDTLIPAKKAHGQLQLPITISGVHAVSGIQADYVLDTGDELAAVTVVKKPNPEMLVSSTERGFYSPSEMSFEGEVAGGWPAWVRTG
jgi:hypothetical protein